MSDPNTTTKPAAAVDGAGQQRTPEESKPNPAHIAKSDHVGGSSVQAPAESPKPSTTPAKPQEKKQGSLVGLVVGLALIGLAIGAAIYFAERHKGKKEETEDNGSQ